MRNLVVAVMVCAGQGTAASVRTVLPWTSRDDVCSAPVRHSSLSNACPWTQLVSVCAGEICVGLFQLPSFSIEQNIVAVNNYTLTDKHYTQGNRAQAWGDAGAKTATKRVRVLSS